ncbi:unnamed protein product [Symbiodinium sp. KB8]|nr:unnamed protein product [Symbiodinium sp. KB8]
MTVPDSPPAPHELDDRTPLERRSMPVPVADAAPRALRGDVTPEFDVPAVAARALGFNMHPADAPASDTAFAVVRDYSVRTFSRADAAEPPEPVLIRVVCCNRLAGASFDFAELPVDVARQQAIQPTGCRSPRIWKWPQRCACALSCADPVDDHGPPTLVPLRDGTNSALYVPLLLDAAVVLTPQARFAWRSRAPFSEWWPAAVDALRARPCVPVEKLTSALQHVALVFAPPVLQSPSVQRSSWAHARAGQVASPSEVVREIAAAPEGHYIAAPLQVLSAEAAFHAGLQTLDAVDLAATLRKRVLTLQSVPVQVRSTLRAAFRAGLQLVADESSAESTLRGWKLFYLAARMLLHRAPAKARIPTAELERRCELFRRGRADAPAAVVAAIRAGRIAALRKPNGRVRALVVGDVLRRLVGRTLAQEYASELQAACMPFQYSLSTRAGTEGLVRLLLRVATEIDPRATVLSIDAIGAFDHVSRHAMFAGLGQRPGLQPLLPYVRHNSMPPTARTLGRGGARRPAHARFARHRATPPALAAVHTQLQEGKAVFAYLDDIYVVAVPERIRELLDACQRALLGIYVHGILATKRTEHDRLLTRIPEVPDLQAAWLLLQYCAAPRANYLLRNHLAAHGYRVPAWDAPELRHPARFGRQQRSPRKVAGVATLSPRCLLKGEARLTVGASDGADTGGVNSKLSSVPAREAIADDLYPARVGHGDREIPRDSSLEREGAGGKGAGGRAGCSVVAERVKQTTAGAERGRERQRKAQTAGGAGGVPLPVSETVSWLVVVICLPVHEVLQDERWLYARSQIDGAPSPRREAFGTRGVEPPVVLQAGATVMMPLQRETCAARRAERRCEELVGPRRGAKNAAPRTQSPVQALAAQVRHFGRFLKWFLTPGIPHVGLAAIEFDVRVLAGCSLANVLQLTDSLRGRDNVHVVKVGKNRLAFMQLLVDSSEGGVLSDGVKSRQEPVVLLASLGSPNLA